jgi:RimJ/RimL family protein N-acetyltransferase
MVTRMAEFEPMPQSLMTDRLHLRPWSETDAPMYRQLWAERDPRSLRVIGLDGRPTVEDLRSKIRSQLVAAGLSGIGLMALERREQKDLIGYCGLIGRDASPDEPEMAYELLREAHGNGYATEAALAVRDAAAATGRSRLWAGVRVWNAASMRVMDKLGFVSSGRIDRDLERGDMIWMTCRLART